MGQVDMSLHSHRFDLTKPMVVFGGLLLTASAICSTLDTTASVPVIGEDVQVVAGEESFSLGEANPFAYECDRSQETQGETSAAVDTPTSDDCFLH
jgi:hypothetical protein